MNEEVKVCIADTLKQYAGAFFIDCADGQAGMLERAADHLADRVAERLAGRTPASCSPDVVGRWSVSFHGSPPSAFVKSGKEGLPDSRRDLSYFEYATIGQRNAHGKHLRALVNEHNKAADALESMMREKDAMLRALDYAKEHLSGIRETAALAELQRIVAALDMTVDKGE